MQSKSKQILSLMIAFLCAMMLSQPVLAYRRKDPWALVERFRPEPPVVLFHLIIVCIVITVASVILSFIVKGKASVTLRFLGAVTSLMGFSFSMTFFGDMFTPLGIILGITAIILLHFSGYFSDRSSMRSAALTIALLVAMVVSILIIIWAYQK